MKDQGPTAQSVLIWMKEAWPRKQTYPTLGDCHALAQSIATIRDVRKGREARKLNASDEKAMAALLKNGGVVLKHAPTLLRQLEDDAGRLAPEMTVVLDAQELARVQALLQQVQAARDALSVAITSLKSYAKRAGDVDPAIWIKQHLQDTWERTDDTRPKSNRGPVALFIKNALGAINDHRSVDAIEQSLKRSLRGDNLSN